MKFGIVVFPGSNCDRDTFHFINDELGYNATYLWHKEPDLKNCDFIILPGGFSYGDYLRTGAIARFSPIMSEVMKHAHKGGYVLGICNGFQILTECHLLPGALLKNEHTKFTCNNQFIVPGTNNSLLTHSLEVGKDVLKIPIAHGDGRFFAGDEELSQMLNNDQILFYYSDQDGNINPDSNPNGSLINIAGICNGSRNVFGMMPHPERAGSHIVGNTDGQRLFDHLLEFAL